MTRCLIATAGILLFSMASGLAQGPQPSDVADTAMRQDTGLLRTLLAQGSDVNAPQVDGSTALHWAVYHDDLDTVELLIEAGADVRSRTREDISPLYMASLYGNTALIEKLLDAGADAAELGPNGETTVMLAARNGNADAIRLLLGAGAEVNAAEPIRGTTALMWAAEQRHPEAVAALLERGADFSVRSGGSGLPRVYMANRVNTRTVEEAQERLRAIAAGEPVPEPAPRGRGGFGGFGRRGPGAPGAEDGGVGAAAGDDNNDGNDAAGAGAGAGFGGFGQGRRPDRNAADNTGADGEGAAAEGEDQDAGPVAGLVGGGGGGLTALVFAAREGDLDSARLLVEAGADVNQVTNYGWTPLLTATNNRQYRLGRYLLESGADVNIANQGGMTPLYLATDNRNIEGGDYPVPVADMDHLEYIRLLLDHGADVNARVSSNTETRTIFTMQWFFEPGATAFVRASQSGDTQLMRLLLDYGADPLIATDYGDTALSAACGIGWVEGVTYEWSPEETLEAVRMLLDLGLDPNSANQDGRTPLMAAAFKGRGEIVQLLVDRGAKLETRDRGSRDTDKSGSLLAGHTWQALDYADGLVRVGVQSAPTHPDVAALIRRLMTERSLPVPPPNRTVESICIVEICQGEEPTDQEAAPEP